jgi:hypothetical protein
MQSMNLKPKLVLYFEIISSLGRVVPCIIFARKICNFNLQHIQFLKIITVDK